MPHPSTLSGRNIIAFVATRDAARARTFYQHTLGLPLVSDDLPFALVFDVNGTMLRITPVAQFTPAPYTVLGWKVPDVLAAASALKQAGIAFQRYPGMEQDDLGIWSAPGGAKIAWFHDPDGNTLSLTEF